MTATAKLLILDDDHNWHDRCKASGTSERRSPAEDQTMTDQASLFAREDTMLGVCEGLGQELRVPPTLFRVAFAVGLFWNPLAMVVAYLTLGTALALFRRAFPMRPAAAPPRAVEPRPQASNDGEVALARAA